MFPRTIDSCVPATIDAAVDILLADLPLLSRTRWVHLNEEDLALINQMVGHQIVKDFHLWSGNDALLRDCLDAIAAQGEDESDPAKAIVKAMWRKLQETHVLRLVR